jgi:predicted permease
MVLRLQETTDQLCHRNGCMCLIRQHNRRNTNNTQVFGNSNSLPISLVTSLAFTVKGLHWAKEPHDNDASVSSRGITYLVLFQQLGQVLRWSWGYRVLLAPPEMYKDEEEEEQERINSGLESGRYRDEPFAEHERENLLDLSDDEVSPSTSTQNLSKASTANSRAAFESGAATPMNRKPYATSSASVSTCSTCDGQHEPLDFTANPNVLPTPANGNVVGYGPGNFAGHDEIGNGHVQPNGQPYKPHNHWPAPEEEEDVAGIKAKLRKVSRKCKKQTKKVGSKIGAVFSKLFSFLPKPLQRFLSGLANGIWENLNPPLFAMIAALPVVLVPQLKHLLFEVEFFEHSLTRAIKQSGDVAVPLIIVVLGANLARNTLPKEQQSSEDPKFERKLLIASLVARMLLPMLVMAPILTLLARFLPINILGDPIFIIVCYLLAGAPSALQLAQICQINNVYMGTMTGLLFHSYVIWYVQQILSNVYSTNEFHRILPSTLILVMLALETLEWAQQANAL